MSHMIAYLMDRVQMNLSGNRVSLSVVWFQVETCKGICRSYVLCSLDNRWSFSRKEGKKRELAFMLLTTESLKYNTSMYLYLSDIVKQNLITMGE